LTVEPLLYHVEVAAELERLEPVAWAAFAVADATGRGAPGPEMADPPVGGASLPASEALDPTVDARAFTALARAAGALGVAEPVALHRTPGPTLASIVRLPGEVRVLLSADLLDRLDEPGLTAVLGHELGHLALWTASGGRFLVAGRLLEALARDPQSPAVYAETARRFAAASEALADRGAALACGSDAVAAAALASVRGEREGSGSGTEAALDIGRLDVLDRARLEAATRALIEDALSVGILQTDVVLAHARSFFPDLDPVALAPDRAAPRPVPDPATPETLRYLAYVLLDLATVDRTLEEPGLTGAAAVASAVGLDGPFAEAARREFALGDRAWDRIARLAAGAAGDAGPAGAAGAPA
jgi:hypothetical protein